MVRVPALPKLVSMCVVWLLLVSSATVARADGVLVQRIGDLSGDIADAVVSEVTVVPFSPHLDARTTPILLATRKAFIRRDGKRVAGLTPEERRAIRQAYAAGQAIMLLDVSTHAVEALHLLLGDGVPHESTTHPVALAYALRSENGLATARLVVPTSPADEPAWSRAVDIVVAELTRPPAGAGGDATASTDWGASPVQSTVITSTDNGVYNTPIQVYALHSCQENMDYYLVNTGGDWTATDAGYESASAKDGQISVDSNHDLTIDWQASNAHCTGGIDVSGTVFGDDERICRYINYPLSYEIDIEPPSGPTVEQVNATPAGNQGKSENYQSGFSFIISGGVNVSGKGPSAGVRAGVSWSNSVQTTVPPLVINAGDVGNEGTFTKYMYCTVGSSVEDCTSTIQMVGQSAACVNLDVGEPQNGQTPNGRLSDVAQTVNWRVDPSTYAGGTFDITVTWQVDLATSTSNLWTSEFLNLPPGRDGNTGPTGYCNQFGCSCGIQAATAPTTVTHTFKVPIPATQCPS